FTGKVQHIAQIHQYGLKDRPNPHAQNVQYPARQLLGFSHNEEVIVEKIIIEYLDRKRL
ncbi:TPA: phage virion morphogenesis protein, partial [Escherichia coli]|nr:phage virion morphogenesis protein [Escherichia coli]